MASAPFFYRGPQKVRALNLEQVIPILGQSADPCLPPGALTWNICTLSSTTSRIRAKCFIGFGWGSNRADCW